MNSALLRGSAAYFSFDIFKNAWVARQLALSGSNICSTSYGWNSFTSLGHGSFPVDKNQLTLPCGATGLSLMFDKP